jgi:hypothetical protein
MMEDVGRAAEADETPEQWEGPAYEYGTTWGPASTIDPSRDRLQAFVDADKRCGETVSDLLAAHKDRDTHIIHPSQEEWDGQVDAFDARDAARAALIPTEQDAIKLMFECHQRLQELGWREVIYCPKDGSVFDAISPGSTGIHPTHYSGDWPSGSWWCEDGGDIWPSRPCLYRPTAQELAEDEARRLRFRALCDSDGSPQGAPGHSS